MSAVETMEPKDSRIVTPGYIIVPMLTLTRAVDLYLGDLTRRVYAANTIRTYRDILDKFVDSFPADTDVHEVKPDDVRRYMDRFNRNTAGTRCLRFSILAGFFKWLDKNDRIKANPMAKLEQPRRVPAEDMAVKSVTSAEVIRMLAACQTWQEKLTISILAYLGPRKHATAMLRLDDYDQARQMMRFHEKGGKTIDKPVPLELADTILAAAADGAFEKADGWLIPNAGPRPANAPKATRDDRVIYDTVLRVAARVGVDTHVHALRAAFAVHCIESRGMVREQVQASMGHKSPATTEIYFRKLDRTRLMEPLRELSWADNAIARDDTQTAEETFGEPGLVGAGGFEPPQSEPGLSNRRHSLSRAEALDDWRFESA